MNSGLYLVLLFHLYKQRFEELLRLSYDRVARQSVSLAPTWTLRRQAPNTRRCCLLDVQSVDVLMVTW